MNRKALKFGVVLVLLWSICGEEHKCFVVCEHVWYVKLTLRVRAGCPNMLSNVAEHLGMFKHAAALLWWSQHVFCFTLWLNMLVCLHALLVRVGGPTPFFVFNDVLATWVCLIVEGALARTLPARTGVTPELL